MSGKTTDFLIIGAGIVGLCVARELQNRQPRSRIVVVEKERLPGMHASGRNSGVLHAGLYYDSSSLKAKFCREGARKIRDFCSEYKIPVFNTGKVVVPTGTAGPDKLVSLKQRAEANGVRVELIDTRQLLEIEPACIPVEKALYSPDTASVEPGSVVDALARSLLESGVVFRFGSSLKDVDVSRQIARFGNDELHFSRLINCAGAGSLAVARCFSLGTDLILLPFRGSYYEIESTVSRVRGNIYPIPDPKFPFLGVHLSRLATGRVFAGPTALPVLGGENYHGLQGIEWGTAWRAFEVLIGEYFTDRGGLRAHVHRELASNFKHFYLKKIRELLPALKADEMRPSGKRGIRAQLYCRRTRRLVHDFLVERTDSSVHVLNAVSPGFTSAPSFAVYLADLAINGDTSQSG